jgi:predicted flap endonuclease-1-like 5' DNA nuclease
MFVILGAKLFLGDECMDIQDIEGIGKTYAEKFKNADVQTTDDLLAKGGTPKGREELAASTGLTENQILEWVNRADLHRISGIGSEYADLLETAGVDSVAELAQRNAENLADKLRAVNEVKQKVRSMPGIEHIGEWILQARCMQKAVEY